MSLRCAVRSKARSTRETSWRINLRRAPVMMTYCKVQFALHSFKFPIRVPHLVFSFRCTNRCLQLFLIYEGESIGYSVKSYKQTTRQFI